MRLPPGDFMTISFALLLQGPMPPMPWGPMIAPQVVQIVQSFFVTIAVIALGIPIIRALSRRFLERAPAPASIPADVSARLERIEQAVDAIAIEVERVSEAQRFQTKLMAEARALPQPDASAVAASSAQRVPNQGR
jgi:hypothetical protein